MASRKRAAGALQVALVQQHVAEIEVGGGDVGILLEGFSVAGGGRVQLPLVVQQVAQTIVGGGELGFCSMALR